ncbi:MAG TPA: hypothetical protein VHI71_11240 [Actinomycetota bacterium]|nr:hypothetical protein [Actinomycetota bacterium]
MERRRFHPAARLPVYAGAGFAFEAVFSALHDLQRGRRVTLRTSPWMLTVYALLLPLYEPVHDRLRGRPFPLRASVYGLGFLAVEYVSGRAFRRLLGDAPWDYTYAKRHVDGLIRPDYFFLWALAGVLCERLHDALDPP